MPIVAECADDPPCSHAHGQIPVRFASHSLRAIAMIFLGKRCSRRLAKSLRRGFAVKLFASGNIPPADGVICIDVLEHCHAPDTPWIVEELFARARSFVFVNVACYLAKCRFANGENILITLRPAAYWRGVFGMISANYPGTE